MLDRVTLVALKIRARRQSLGLSLRELGRRVGTSHAYIYQVEAGLRPLAPQREKAMQQALGIGGLGNPVRRGRPPLSPEGRRVLRELRRSHGLPMLDLLMRGAPGYPRAEREKPSPQPFWSSPKLRALEQQRSGEQHFWRLLNSLRFDSGSERVLALEVALGCQALTGVAPAEVGCRLKIVSGRTGRDRFQKAYSAFLLRRGELAVAWFTQPCVATGVGFRWPDNLLVASYQGQRRTLVVEVDGPAFHRCGATEEERDRELQVPVLHLHPEKWSLQAILDWVRGQFQ